MTITYDDLNPLETTIDLGGKEYTLRKFDLMAQVWAKNEFATAEQSQGMYILGELLKKTDTAAILKTTWHLVKNKFMIGTFDTFVETLEKEKFKHLKVMEFLQAINKTMGVSQLQIDEIQEDLELKKSLAAVM